MKTQAMSSATDGKYYHDRRNEMACSSIIIVHVYCNLLVLK